MSGVFGGEDNHSEINKIRVDGVSTDSVDDEECRGDSGVDATYDVVGDIDNVADTEVKSSYEDKRISHSSTDDYPFIEEFVLGVDNTLWRSYYTDYDGVEYPYYLNVVTNESQWTDPREDTEPVQDEFHGDAAEHFDAETEQVDAETKQIDAETEDVAAEAEEVDTEAEEIDSETNAKATEKEEEDNIWWKSEFCSPTLKLNDLIPVLEAELVVASDNQSSTPLGVLERVAVLLNNEDKYKEISSKLKLLEKRRLKLFRDEVLVNKMSPKPAPDCL